MKNFNSNNSLEQVVKLSDDQDLDVWSLPDVTQETSVENEKTNAFGKKSTWVYEPPEVDEPVLAPLTADEIESIRQAAHEEGFNQGKEEGFTAGFEKGLKSGHEEGVTKGHEDGLEQGLAQGKEEIEKLTQQWQQLIEQLHQPMKVVESHVEQQLLQLVVKLTEAVTLHETKMNPEIILSAIKAGMKALPVQEAQTQILLHPDDIKLIEKEVPADVITEQGWRLLAAPQLTPGGCQIENSTSNIDLTLETKLKEVLDSFLQDALHQ
ncbi:flagellar assembly protein FliH [Thalassotalea profundi]|uniref:Flagellar assembly protein FliH n=1 Tax=Thalassotalea profundi TaxID=2036687 RepID=A0ABQ3IGQ9_9GAMM|nr:flagellar assembly protein FliH [Thalassotalea profundi]GHE80861.1 flagellar assembly protein FliH [Thalassotalea profundi]